MRQREGIEPRYERETVGADAVSSIRRVGLDVVEGGSQDGGFIGLGPAVLPGLPAQHLHHLAGHLRSGEAGAIHAARRQVVAASVVGGADVLADGYYLGLLHPCCEVGVPPIGEPTHAVAGPETGIVIFLTADSDNAPG